MDENRLQQARILIVDDYLENVTLLTRIFRRAGYTHLSSISDARQVADRVQELQPDLILLDLRMPHLDGFAVMEEIRPHLSDASVILVTGEVDEDIIDEALAKGASDVLTKPFDVHDVLSRAERQLRARLFDR